MKGPRTAAAIRCLRWVVGLVVLIESYRTFHGAFAGVRGGVHPDSLTWVRLVLSGLEILAALLFLIPWTLIPGAYVLLGIFVFAVAIHALHGDFAGLEFLVLYAAAVFVSLANRKDALADPSELPAKS